MILCIIFKRGRNGKAFSHTLARYTEYAANDVATNVTVWARIYSIQFERPSTPLGGKRPSISAKQNDQGENNFQQKFVAAFIVMHNSSV